MFKGQSYHNHLPSTNLFTCGMLACLFWLHLVASRQQILPLILYPCVYFRSCMRYLNGKCQRTTVHRNLTFNNNVNSQINLKKKKFGKGKSCISRTQLTKTSRINSLRWIILFKFHSCLLYLYHYKNFFLF